MYKIGQKIFIVKDYNQSYTDKRDDKKDLFKVGETKLALKEYEIDTLIIDEEGLHIGDNTLELDILEKSYKLKGYNNPQVFTDYFQALDFISNYPNQEDKKICLAEIPTTKYKIGQSFQTKSWEYVNGKIAKTASTQKIEYIILDEDGEHIGEGGWDGIFIIDEEDIVGV